MNDNERQSTSEQNLLESLEKSHAILKSVVESPKGVVIFALDRQYRYIAFNRNHHQTMKQIWGVDIALGNSMFDYIGTADDRLKAKKNFDRALSGESFTLEEEYGDIALERRYYEDTYNPIIDEDGDIIGLTLFLTDITQRKRTETALQESEARWQFALEGAGDGVWDMNFVTGKVYYSSRWKSMLGYGDEEIDDTMDIWKSLLHPDDRENVLANIERYMNGETPIYQSEHRLRCKDGSYKWILSRGKEIGRTEDGEPLRIIGTHTDISETKQLLQKHEHVINELQEALAKVKQLSGMLPICAYCKKIRDDKGYWRQIETYIRDHSEADFSHGICRECAEKHHPELFETDG